MFAYLAPLVKAPFPNSTLGNHVKGIPNLTRFVGRINQKNFRQVTDGMYFTLHTRIPKKKTDYVLFQYYSIFIVCVIEIGFLIIMAK